MPISNREQMPDRQLFLMLLEEEEIPSTSQTLSLYDLLRSRTRGSSALDLLLLVKLCGQKLRHKGVLT